MLEDDLSGRKIFVGGLPKECTEEHLRSHFSQVGDVKRVLLPRDRTTLRPRGFGYVIFESEAGAEAAFLNSSENVISGKWVEVKVCTPKGESSVDTAASEASDTPAAAGESLGEDEETSAHVSCKIFVGGLPQDIEVDQLLEFGGQFGEIADVVLPLKPGTNTKRGFGFLVFADPHSVDLAMETFDSNTIEGKWVEVKKCVPKEKMQAPWHQQQMQSPHVVAPPAHRLARQIRPGGDKPLTVAVSGNGAASPHNSSPTNPYKIFVGGLPKYCEDAQFESYFSQFGNVVEARIMTDIVTKKSRGFGYITYSNANEVSEVLQYADLHEIDGKWVEVKSCMDKGSVPPALPAVTSKPLASRLPKLPMWQRQPPVWQQQLVQTAGAYRSQPSTPPGKGLAQPNAWKPQVTAGAAGKVSEHRIFVGGLPKECTVEQLRISFSLAGAVSAEVPTNRETGLPRGFGYVTFRDQTGVEMAVANYDQNMVDGKWVEVKRCVSKEAMATGAGMVRNAKSGVRASPYTRM